MSLPPFDRPNILTAEYFLQLNCFYHTDNSATGLRRSALKLLVRTPLSLDLGLLTMGFYQLATKAQALAIKAMGATLDHIERITEIKRRALQYIFKKARSRGWDPVCRPLLLDGYIIDAPRTGRKIKITREFEQRIIKKATSDRYGREKSSAYIAAECGCSEKTVWRVLRRHGYRKTKPTRKPCLHQR